MKQKYKYEIVGTVTRDNNRPLYRLSTTKNKKPVEKLVGLGALRTMHCDGSIVGYIPEYIKTKLGIDRRKTRSDKKGYVAEVKEIAPKMIRTIVEPPINNWHELKAAETKKWNLRDEVKVGWSLPNEWVAPNLNEPEKAVEKIETKPKPKINIKAYLYENKGQWHVIECNGIEDEDTYPDKEWAQRVVDDLNNSSTDELDKV